MKIHFFTIVYNGMPYIDKHMSVLRDLDFEWHWHIVEGLADLKGCTSWSVNNGAIISKEQKKLTLSTDGTKEYLDLLCKQFPQNISIYRKDEGVLWNGKLEMVNAPLKNIQEHCLLWQIDNDEIWDSTQITAIRNEFIANPKKTAAWYWCEYYLGTDIHVCTRNCYTQNPIQEWLRTWKFNPGDKWTAHEPPILSRADLSGSMINVGLINPILHERTEELGAVFRHYSFVTQEQLRFKEQYYGYKHALHEWKIMQEQLSYNKPELLSKYLSFVLDDTFVKRTGVELNEKIKSDMYDFREKYEAKKQLSSRVYHESKCIEQTSVEQNRSNKILINRLFVSKSWRYTEVFRKYADFLYPYFNMRYIPYSESLEYADLVFRIRNSFSWKYTKIFRFCYKFYLRALGKRYIDY